MKKFHFIGIGGIGLSGLARFLKNEGHHISGSDLSQTTLTKELSKEGIEVCIPHEAKNITNQDYVIYSAVVKDENEELLEARKKGILTLSRKEALPIILKNKKVFSICGAHGKSTTSAMLASIMEGSAIIGAESKQFGSNVKIDLSDTLVFEADESDESFLNSNPFLALVTNAEPEHMEYYQYDYERFYGAYKTFLTSAKLRVINAEDPFLSTLENLEAIRLYPSKDITEIKTIVKNGEPFTSFVLKDLGTFEVWGIGEHMALDASLAILAALTQMNLEEVRKKLKNFRGIKKRFDILLKNRNYAIIDDYAHHPTEIEATLKSAKEYAHLLGLKKVTAVWQPHKYSRTQDNLEKFIECFEGVDELIILPVWRAGEAEIKIDFEEKFKRYNPLFADEIARKENTIEFLKDQKEIKSIEDGLVIGFGAGDITYQLRGYNTCKRF